MLSQAARTHDVRVNPAFHSGQHLACSTCSLAELCLPMGLNHDDMQRVDDLVERSELMHEGEHLFRIGDRFKRVYAVRVGTYKSYTVDSEGREHVLGFHLPGELIGLDAIHSGVHRSNAVALDTATVCMLSYEALDKLAGEISGLRTQMFKLMSKDISDAAALAGDFTAEERIAAFLTSLSKRYHLRGFSPLEFNLTMSRRDIANFLRLAPETVSRVFARFEKDKLIAVERRSLRITALTKLLDMAHCVGEIHA